MCPPKKGNIPSPLTHHSHTHHKSREMSDDPRYENWHLQCNKALTELGSLKHELMETETSQTVLDKLGRLKKLVLLAQDMTPPDYIPPTAEEEAELFDEDDEHGLTELTKVYDGASTATTPVRPPVSNIPPPVTGDIPEAQATNERDENKTTGLLNLGNYGMERSSWIVSEEKRIIEIPLLKDYEDNLRHDDGWKEAWEDAKKHSVPKTHPKPPRMRCNLCINQGKSGLNENGVGYLNRLDVHGNTSSLMIHIRQYHKNIFITPVKCGCDGAGDVKFSRNGFTHFSVFSHHIRAKPGGNIHSRERNKLKEELAETLGGLEL